MSWLSQMLHQVPVMDTQANTFVRDVIGQKTDSTVTTVSTTTTLTAYLKGLITNFIVPTADTANNVNVKDVIGNKTDAAVTAVGTTNSLMALTKGLVNVNGILLSKDITLNINNTTGSITCWTITGAVEVVRMWGVLKTKTTLANCTAAHWELYDSGAAVDLTLNNGVLSGLAVGTTIVKNAAAAATFGKLDNAAGALVEPSSMYTFDVIKKTGATTTIRFTYTTTDAPSDAVMTMYILYRPLTADGLIA